ncbi:MAG: gamma-glutamyl-gamma-aminobutyrate hydrolase family protein, partial [Acidobacteria bacterium]|nr:gamma-glutamyl-gamma-aminobutyrate hydrolase family protein [Acidobacteriota bacterium]
MGLQTDAMADGFKKLLTGCVFLLRCPVTEPDSLLHGLIQGNCRVNSLHHQAIKRLGHGLKATAHSED